MKRCVGVCIAAVVQLAAASTVHAYECARGPAVDRPKIGLVLGGGGARGAAHIGVLRVLEEERVPVDYVAGTSMGSLVGGFYATGMNAKQLDETVRSIDFADLFRDSTSREDLPYRRKQDDDLALYGPKLGIGRNSQLLSKGAIHGQKITFLFETLTSQRVQTNDFDKLPIPYRAVAADIVTGDAVVIGEGNLGVAMRASMSVPGAFDPVEIGDKLLVDGGIANNLPIDVVRSLGAEQVIAVEVGTPLDPRDKLKTIVNFTAQLSGILVVRNSNAQIATLTPNDLLLRPPLGDDISSAGFEKVEDAIKIGYKEADRHRAEIAKYAIDPAAYAEHRRYIEACVAPTPPVQFVRIDNNSRFSDEVIKSRIHVPIGKPLDRDALEHEIKQVYALGYIDLARYEIVEENGETGVVLHVQQDARGTTFLEWGLDVFGDGDDADVNLRLATLKTDVDDYGSEARLLTQVGETPAIAAELYKSILPNQSLFIYPRVFAERRNLVVFDDSGNEDADVQVDQWGGELSLVHELGRYATILGGVRRYTGEVKVDLGDIPNVDDEGSFDGGEYYAQLYNDRLNDRYFPGSGSKVTLTYSKSTDELGADVTFEQVAATALGAATFGVHTLIGGAKYSTTIDSDAPVYALFRAGGLFNLSGIQPNEISGQHFGMAFASYRYEPGGEEGGLFPAYIGLSAEYGNATDDRDDVFGEGIANGSIYFGYRSPVGPLYWGAGFAEGGQRTYFLRIGNVFGTSSIGR